MSIVQPWLPGARVVDLFAGSGALGLEALSRGAVRCTFVEGSERSLIALRANIAKLGAGDRATIKRSDALGYLAVLTEGDYDVGFADPPYDRGLASAVVECWLNEPFATILGVEHSKRETMPPGGYWRKYGGTMVTFYGLRR